MTSALVSHRDDGLLARAVARLAPRALPPVPTALVGCAALAGGLLLDGDRTAIATLLGVAAFVLLGALSAGGRHGPLRWVVPPLLHAGEYATVIVLGWRAGMPPAVFALLAVVAAHHYDLLYQDPPAAPRPASGLTGGWEGRILVVAIASYAGALAAVSSAAAAWLAAVLVVSATRRVRTLLRHDPTAGGRAS